MCWSDLLVDLDASGRSIHEPVTVFHRGAADAPAELGGEMGGAAQADAVDDLADGEGGIQEQLFGAFHPDQGDLFVDGSAPLLTEADLQRTPGAGQLFQQ